MPRIISLVSGRAEVESRLWDLAEALTHDIILPQELVAGLMGQYEQRPKGEKVSGMFRKYYMTQLSWNQVYERNGRR